MKQKYALIVEDDELLRISLVSALENEGIRVLSAHSGQFAIRIFQQRGHEIAWILTDYEMPEGNGLWLAKNIKMLDCTRPIVLFTASDLEKLKDEEIKIFFKIVKKPKNLKYLLELAQELFEAS